MKTDREVNDFGKRQDRVPVLERIIEKFFG